MNIDFLKPILAQAARDILRTIGTGLLAHGVIQNGAGVEAFVGAGMTLCGLAWGWWTSVGHVQAAALLKKLTDTKSDTAAVAVAKAMPSAAATGAAEVAKTAVAKGVVSVLLLAIGLSLMIGWSGVANAQGQKFVSPLKAATGSFNATTTQAAPAPDKCPLIIDPLKLCGLLTGDMKTDAQRVADRIRLSIGNDVEYAIAKATAANTPASVVRLQCYNAVKDAHDRFTGASIKRPDGTDWPRPDPAAITAVEDVAELIDDLSPQGKLLTSCAGAAKLVGLNALQFVNGLVTGSAAIAAGAPLGL